MGELQHARHHRASSTSREPASPVPVPGKSTQVPSAAPATTAAKSEGSQFSADRLPWEQSSSGQGASSIELVGGTSGAKDEHSVEAKAIVTSFAAAQHALEAGSIESALTHLWHVASAAAEYDRKSDVELVSAAADSFHHALVRAAGRQPVDTRRLVELDLSIRNQLALGAASARVQNHAGGTDVQYAKSAIGPALELLSQRVSRAMELLESDQSDGDTRVRLVEQLAQDIAYSSGYVGDLLGQMSRTDRVAFKATVEEPARWIGQALRFVRTRTPHKQLEEMLLPSVHEFDEVLGNVGATSIERRTAATLTERAQYSGDNEKRAVDTAYGAVKSAIDKVDKRQSIAINAFNGLANLDDTVAPDFKTDLLKALITAVVGQVFAVFSQALSQSPARSSSSTGNGAAVPSQPAAGAAVTRVVSIGLSSTYQAISTVAIPTNVDQRKRALVYFTVALQSASRNQLEAVSKNIDRLVGASAIRADELSSVASALELHAELVFDHVMTHATKAWASYLAQSRLGARRAGGMKVTKMDDYFGQPHPGGREFGTDRSGGDGVLSIYLRIDRAGAKPQLDASRTRVIGLNSELKQIILRDAGHDVRRVSLPKEIHIDARFAHATIALDEQNRLRDVSGWEEVERYVGMSAYSFWKAWGHSFEVK